MKFKTTKKAIRDNYDFIISIGYCNLQRTLSHENPTAYSTRGDGWACDYYDLDGFMICTGYSPIESKNTKPLNYETTQKYELKAEKIIHDNRFNFEKSKEDLRKLIDELIAECKYP